MNRHPLTDRERDRFALREVAEIVAIAGLVVGCLLLVRWWVWYR